MLKRWMTSVVAGFLLIPTLSLAACPTNRAQTAAPNGPSDFQSSEAIWNLRIPCGHLAVDLVAGTVELVGGGAGGEYSCYTSLDVSDLYQIVGPASATPIPFEVHIHVTGEVTGGLRGYPNGTFCDNSRILFRLASGATANSYSDQSSFSPCSGHAFDAGVVVSLAKLPSESFPLSMHLEAGGSGGFGTNRGALTFTGLPAGYSVQSCQGYGSQPVATLPRSWGNLKHTYR